MIANAQPSSAPAPRPSSPGSRLTSAPTSKISCPTLVCDAEGDLFFNGQTQLLYDHLTCPKTMIRFTNAEGAVAHCQVGAGPLAFARIYDWLDETLG